MDAAIPINTSEKGKLVKENVQNCSLSEVVTGMCTNLPTKINILSCFDTVNPNLRVLLT